MLFGGGFTQKACSQSFGQFYVLFNHDTFPNNNEAIVFCKSHVYLLVCRSSIYFPLLSIFIYFLRNFFFFQS